MSAERWILVTGATGLLGREVLARLLAADARLHAFVLVRDASRWPEAARELGACRAVPLTGDLCTVDLGLTPDVRAALRQRVTAIVHLAADTTFSAPLEHARAVNTDGTRRLLELAADCVSRVRIAYVSTAFVAGRRTGMIAEDAAAATEGWVNAYEQSKYEAEQLVRERAASWVMLRPSTVVCDDVDGRITQMNAVHRALRLYHGGLAAMMPGVAGSTVDVVTTTYVAGAIARLALREDTSGQIVHLCAGDAALPLDELLDITYERWARDPEWRRRGIARPAVTDPTTYSLFERTIDEVGDPSLKRLTRALSHFVPQLALPKRFATTNAEALLGHSSPPVRAFWLPMLDHLLASRQRTRAMEVAA
ncbi:MAG TPA: SDR family oxidoreductase [Gemmatimonadaceae bacterium]